MLNSLLFLNKDISIVDQFKSMRKERAYPYICFTAIYALTSKSTMSVLNTRWWRRYTNYNSSRVWTSLMCREIPESGNVLWHWGQVTCLRRRFGGFGKWVVGLMKSLISATDPSRRTYTHKFGCTLALRGRLRGSAVCESCISPWLGPAVGWLTGDTAREFEWSWPLALLWYAHLAWNH